MRQRLSDKLYGRAPKRGIHIPFLRERFGRRDIMDNGQQMRITRRAYELWQQAGEPKGRDEEFYRQAARELKEGAKSNEGNNPASDCKVRL
jgi:Protein of unknown function (DUF2934)